MPRMRFARVCSGRSGTASSCRAKMTPMRAIRWLVLAGMLSAVSLVRGAAGGAAVAAAVAAADSPALRVAPDRVKALKARITADLPRVVERWIAISEIPAPSGEETRARRTSRRRCASSGSTRSAVTRSATSPAF